jgi:hypothetical protein
MDDDDNKINDIMSSSNKNKNNKNGEWNLNIMIMLKNLCSNNILNHQNWTYLKYKFLMMLHILWIIS